MKKSKLTHIVSMLLATVCICLVCICIIVPTIDFSKPSSSAVETIIYKDFDSSNDENSNSNDDSSDNSNNEQDDDSTSSDSSSKLEDAAKLQFFINTQAVKKSKEIIGNTTTFTIKLKVFATNDSKQEKTLLTSGFTGSYAINNYASFYTFDCLNEESSKIIAPNQTGEFDISIKYIITDNKNFNDEQKYNLAISYMSEEVISSYV